MSNTKTIQIQDLGEGVILKTPIGIEVDFFYDGPVATYEPLGLYIFGDTPAEIEKEIKAQILDLIDHLRDIDESRLGKKPLKWKKHLEEILPIRKGKYE